MSKSWLASVLNLSSHSRIERRRKSESRKLNSTGRRQMLLERLDDRRVLAAVAGVPNPNELVESGFTANELASALVGGGLSISNATFTGGSSAAGSFTFTDSTVIGFGQGIMLSSGNVADVVGPNAADWTSTDFTSPGDTDLTNLSGYQTFDAAVLEFDFVPTANQVVFQYTFASDEYPEWVNTPYNDVFAFYVNGSNYATVRQVAGDPNSAFVPVAVNNINDGNPLDPTFVAARPDLFRPNYVDPNGGPSAIDLELDGLTHVLTFQAPVNPGVTNHMKLAIADASDGIYDSAVFIQAGSLVSNENPVADLSLLPLATPDSSTVTAVVEAEDPNGLPLTYAIDWGDGNSSSGPLNSPVDDNEKTALVDHTYASAGDYIVTLTVSNGSLVGTSSEDIHIGVGGGGGGGGGGDTLSAPVVVTNPVDQVVSEGDLFTFTASATGNPAPEVQWQVSTDGGQSFDDIPGAKNMTYSGMATLGDNGNLYQAIFSNDEGEAVTTAAMLTVAIVPVDDIAPDAPIVILASDTGASDADGITSVGYLAISGIEEGAVVEYSVDGGNTWTADFVAAEGQNAVLVRQTDQAGNASDATILDFRLDTQAPQAPQLALLEDSGSSASDGITNNGALAISGVEADALVEYSADGGSTWADSFFAQEGLNSVQSQQADLAGNISAAGTLNFLLDTTAPTLNPTFSAGSQPILLNAQGVTVSPNASDNSGIATQSAGVVDTATAGQKSLVCSATDLAGNSTSVNVPYVVGYAIMNVATFHNKSSVSVSFQLADANGRISDAAAASLAGKIVITFDSQTFSGVKYNKHSDRFWLKLKPSHPSAGTHTLGIHVYAGADKVATLGAEVNFS